MTTATLTPANNNTTWTVPNWVYSLQVEVWGAGGGGAGANNANKGVAGGGGGAYARSNLAVTPGQALAVIIGTGGNGGGNNANGVAGGYSAFNNNQVLALAGGGATRGNGPAGTGGDGNNSIGDVKYFGGGGYNVANGTTPGGGGGAGGGNAANGNNAAGQAGATGAGGGGNGGNGGNANTSAAANTGFVPGGGGGGGGNRTSGTKAGGAGGNGQIIITYTATPRIVLSASDNIGANAADNTTALMTAPANKTSGNNFQAGWISDDTNPLPALDLAANKYTELEWAVKAVAANGAANNQVYLLRVTANGTALTTYTVTPQWTIGSAFSGKVSTCIFG